jgi:replicative DNA helicase
VDEVILGFKESEMIVLAARPSMGKTALAMNIAERIALGKTADREPRPVGVFSLEMSTDMLVLRMLCSHARVPTHVLTKGLINEGQRGRIKQAADILALAPIHVDDAGGPDIDTLRAKARRMKKRYNVAAIFIDYLQLIGARGFARKSRNEEVSTVSAGLKAMAKELRIPVVVLSQLSRASEMKGQRKPRLSDLRDSGSIEQDADVVCLLRRPCMLSRDEDGGDPTLAVVEVAKHRNGPTGKICLNFEKEFTRFEDRAHGVDDNSFMIPGESECEEPLPV